MAAINVSQLSDTDLRGKLKGFGENVGPITPTTRRVLEKKLSKILNNENDDTVLTSSKKEQEGSVKRKSIGSQPKRMSSGSGRKSIPRKFAPYSSEEEEETRSDRYKKTVNKSKGEFVDPNETNISISSIPTSISVGQIPLNTRNKRKSVPSSISHSSYPGTSPVLQSRVESNRKSMRSEFSDDDFFPSTESPIQHINSNSKTATSQNSTTYRYKNNESKNHIGGIDKRSYQSTPLPDQSRYSKSNSNRNADHDDASVANMRDEIDASLIQIRKSYSAKKPSPTTKCKFVEEKDDDEEELDAKFVTPKVSYMRIFKDSISGCIIIPLILAFLLLGFYIYTIYYVDENGIPAISNDALEEDGGLNHEFVNCLYKKLSILAGIADCDNVASKWVRNESLTEFVSSCVVGKAIPEKEEVMNLLNAPLYKNFFEINEYGDVSSKASYRPLSCRINQALSIIAFRILMIVGFISCVIGGYFAMKKRWTADDEEMRQILHFVEKIIDTLQRHHEVCQTNKDLPPFLPIPHVRDMLIPLARRKKMARIWRKAVAFLNSSDSRVRVETQRIAGEDFDVWRWIGVCTPKLKKEKKATSETYLTNDQEKCWQGPAFDEIEKVVRMPIVTPTPCLKIRYMHEGLEEKDDKWVKRVENAVLEKCNLDGAQILHIFVDKTSKEGCVYVKCDSLESAGKAFRCMYGNWFDCRLVIVKFVTLARYHQRFPDALRCVEPLKADATIPSSLNWVAEENK